MLSYDPGALFGSAYAAHGWRELDPAHATLALAASGWAPQPVRAACLVGWDLPPAGALPPGPAWWCCRLSGPGADLAAFCARADLPGFDFVAACGVWSVAGPEGQAALVSLLARRLRPGGVFYTDHYATAGCAALLPLQQFVALHACGGEGMGKAGVLPRSAAAVEGIAGDAPAVREALDGLRALHDPPPGCPWLLPEWHPTGLGDVARVLDDAKLGYAAPARLVEAVPELSLAPTHRTVLAELADPLLREVVRDTLLGTAFRRDYWVKGRRRLAAAERDEVLAALPVRLVRPPTAEGVALRTPFGPAVLPAAPFAPVLDMLADGRPRALGDLAPGMGGLADAVRAAAALVHAGVLRAAGGAA